MSISVNFYNFNKKENSTARPSGTGSAYNVVLKDSCSVEAPEIEINSKPASFYNYAYISDFNRYYYVTGWSYYRGVWSARLKVDVLASFKNAIGRSTKYILRAASDYDPEVKDTLYPLKSETVKQVSQASISGWASGFSGGSYIAYINSGNTDDVGNYGSLGFMYFTPTQFSQLLQALYPDSPETWGNTFLTEVYNVVAGTLLNPIDYITRLVWVPKSLPAGDLPTKFGNYVALYGKNKVVKHGNLLSYKETQTVILDIPKRVDTVRGEWSNTEPYAKYYMYFAPFGLIPLNANDLIGATQISCILTLDMTTGALKMTAYTIGSYGSLKDRIFSGTAQVGVEVPIDKAKTEFVESIESSLGALGVVYQTAIGNYSGIAEEAVGGIGSMGEAPSKSSGGGTRGLLAVEDTIYLYNEYSEFVDEDNANQGRPLCKNRQIFKLSGYIVCKDGEIAISGTSDEQSQIKSYLEGGFYYE